jgi:hypothetical protein
MSGDSDKAFNEAIEEYHNNLPRLPLADVNPVCLHKTSLEPHDTIHKCVYLATLPQAHTIRRYNQ